MMKYVYAMRMRPPGLGCQPVDGLIRVTNEPVWMFGKRCWGTAVYNRPLTDEETEHYDMSLMEKIEEDNA